MTFAEMLEMLTDEELQQIYELDSEDRYYVVRELADKKLKELKKRN